MRQYSKRHTCFGHACFPGPRPSLYHRHQHGQVQANGYIHVKVRQRCTCCVPVLDGLQMTVRVRVQRVEETVPELTLPRTPLRGRQAVDSMVGAAARS